MPSEKTKKRPQSKYWCFTLCNPVTYEEPQSLRNYEYLVYQVEVGDEGTEHLQGYVCFKNRTKLSSIKKIMPTAHLEMRGGTHEKAKGYCMKEDTRIMGPYEFGDDSKIPKGRGERSDLWEVKKLLDEDQPESKIQDQCFGSWVRYHKAFELYRSQRGSKRDTPPRVEIYYGVSGSGKSSQALKELPNAFVLNRPANNNSVVWWDGYQTGQDVIMDEFYGWIPYMDILRILDRYAYQVQIKGGFTNFKAPRIIITSNKSPKLWYAKVKDRSALQRRFKEFCTIYEFPNVYEYNPEIEPYRVARTWEEVLEQEVPSEHVEETDLNFGLPTGPRFNI